MSKEQENNVKQYSSFQSTSMCLNRVGITPRQKSENSETCMWRDDEKYDWVGACDPENKNTFFSSPLEMAWKFCPYCGKPIDIR